MNRYCVVGTIWWGMITRFEYQWYCMYVLYVCTVRSLNGFETISQSLLVEQIQHGQSIDLLLMKEGKWIRNGMGM